MYDNEVYNLIKKNILVDRHKIIVAKNYILEQDTVVIEIENLLNKFTSSQGYPMITTFVIHESVPLEEQVQQASGFISWYIAFSQAILELIHNNYLLVTNQQLYPYNGLQINWTTVVPGYGGRSASWNFTEYIVLIPSQVKKSFTQLNNNFTLFDVDLFISKLEIDNAHPDVIEAIIDTITCFKKELYRPTLTMLGKAVEGAWIELGISLLNYAINQNIDEEKNNQLLERLMGPDSFAFKVSKVIDLYSSHYKDWFKPVKVDTNIIPSQLAEIKIWTDVVREARNAIHFGAKVNSDNNYEKTAIILLASISHFKTIYSLKLSADTLVDREK
ncbi:hypothetical protein AWM68_17645 [Fictibacillus phosphorivorans]|uniref:Uncharacterized protein n=1 Tax=Fictibacillus phosphorivorans TaxID=1221500 RepID=A0A165NWY0_9BACL|nr:hypothetical protein [Fictibacillus phosphorivorans]KZE67995.1 hypothetical protein AWM68_17645 [Fictibacillus phosphorivorans]